MPNFGNDWPRTLEIAKQLGWNLGKKLYVAGYVPKRKNIIVNKDRTGFYVFLPSKKVGFCIKQYIVSPAQMTKKEVKNPEVIAKAIYLVQFKSAGNTSGSRYAYKLLTGTTKVPALPYPYASTNVAYSVEKHAEKYTKCPHIIVHPVKDGYLVECYNDKPTHNNPNFAVSLEGQHGTTPVGIIEAPNFLSAYTAAKKKYGPDIDVDAMNPIRRFVVSKKSGTTKRKASTSKRKDTYGRMR